jgi:tripartite-type tricarboxylate transporter receptor subunit TctC
VTRSPLPNRRHALRALAAVAAAGAMPGRTAPAGYPAAAITIVVPYAAGGGGDSFTRAVGAEVQSLLGVKVFVENRTGGGATIGVGAVARARPDGYTLGFASSSPVVVAPLIVRVPYDPIRDLTCLARFAVSPYPLVVRSGDARFRSFAGLLAWARANPGRLKWSTAGMNGAPYVATLAAFRKEGLRTAFIPMQGSTEVMAGLLGGTLDLGVVSDYAGPMAAGDLRALAEIGAERAPELPEAPCFGELGYPLAPSIFYGIIGPAGLPREVIGAWDAAMLAVTRAPRFERLARRLHGRVAYLPHAAFQASVHDDITRTRRELAAAGLIDP